MKGEVHQLEGFVCNAYQLIEAEAKKTEAKSIAIIFWAADPAQVFRISN